MGVRWRKYGAMWISAGMFTGFLGTSVFWWQRASPVVYGVDVAECYAARSERIMAFHKGTNAFQRYTDYVPASNSIDARLTGWRDVVMTNYCNTVRVDTVSFTEHVRILSSTKMVFSTDDYMTNRSIQFVSTNRPIGGADTVIWDLSDEGGAIESITTYNAGLGGGYFASGITTNRGYVTTPTFIQMPNAYVATATLQLLTPPTNNVSVVTNVVPVIEAFDLDGVLSDHLLWRTLYNNVMCASRDLAVYDANRYEWIMEGTNTPDSGSYVFGRGVSDYDNVFWLDSRSADLADGDTVLVNSREWVNSSSNVVYVLWDLLDPPVAYLFHYEREWSLGGTYTTNLTETIATTETRFPNTGVRYPPDVTETNLPVADALCKALGISVENTVAEITHPSDTIAGQENWWKAIGNGTNAYRYLCERTDASNNITSLNRRISTNNLTQVRNVLTNLCRTVYIVRLIDCDKLSAVRYSWQGVTNINMTQTGAYPAFKGYDWFADIDGNMTTPVSSNSADALLYGYVVQYDASSDEFVSRLWKDTDTETDANYGYSAYASIAYDVWHYALQSPYPSEAACNGTNVVKMRVYGIPFVSPSPPDRATPPHTYHPDDFDATCYGGSVQTVQYAWGLFSNYASLQTLPAGIGYAEGGADYLLYGTLSSDRFRDIKLSLIGEWNNPTSRPVINIGTNRLSVPSSALDRNYSKWQMLDSTGVARQRDILEQHYWGMDVSCPALLIEVWWKWEHLGETAYEPEAHTPEWAATNTP